MVYGNNLIFGKESLKIWEIIHEILEVYEF